MNTSKPNWTVKLVPSEHKLDWRTRQIVSRFYSDCQFTPTRIEDIRGFTQLSSELRFGVLWTRALDLQRFCPYLTYNDMETRMGMKRYVTGVLYRPYVNTGSPIKSIRLRSGSFLREFEQDPHLLEWYGVTSPWKHVNHFWQPYGWAPLPSKFVPAWLTNPQPTFLTLAEGTPLHAFLEPLWNSIKWLSAPPFQYGCEASWLIFNPPLTSVAQNVSIYGFWTISSPAWCKPDRHPRYDPILQAFPYDMAAPFHNNAWFSPKWGSRIDGTRVNEVCLFIERWGINFGNYISKRVGFDIPLWEIRGFFEGPFNVIRTCYSYFLKPKPQSLYAEFQKYLKANSKTGLFDFTEVSFVSTKGETWGLGILEKFNCLNTFTYLLNEQLFTCAVQPPLIGFVFLLTCAFIVLHKLWKLFYTLILCNVFVVLIWTLAQLAFYLTLRPLGLIAIAILYKIIGFSLALTWFKFLLWVFCIGLIYLAFLEIENFHKYWFLLERELPHWAYQYILTYDSKKWIYLLFLPLLINLIFGDSTLVSVEIQRGFTVLITGITIFYLSLVLLIYDGVNVPFLDQIPRLAIKKYKYKEKLKEKAMIIFDSKKYFELWIQYPMIPSIFHKWWHKFKMSYWRKYFFLLSCFFLFWLGLVFIIFSINLEGMVGPLCFTSWSDIFR